MHIMRKGWWIIPERHWIKLIVLGWLIGIIGAQIANMVVERVEMTAAFRIPDDVTDEPKCVTLDYYRKLDGPVTTTVLALDGAKWSKIGDDRITVTDNGKTVAICITNGGLAGEWIRVILQEDGND